MLLFGSLSHNTTFSQSVAPAEEVDNTYHDLAAQGIVHPLQATGMTAIRNGWANPEARNYSPEESQRILGFRAAIPQQLERMHSEGNLPWNATRKAHTQAAAVAGTAPTSGDLIYYPGEVLAGSVAKLMGDEVATAVFTPASEIFNDPIGNRGRTNRNALCSAVQGVGTVLLRSPSMVGKGAGAALAIAGKTMQGSEDIALMEYHNELKTPMPGTLPAPRRLKTSVSSPMLRSLVREPMVQRGLLTAEQRSSFCQSISHHSQQSIDEDLSE